jgi:predicted acyl esterase
MKIKFIMKDQTFSYLSNKYKKYLHLIYKTWVRTSQYITVRDGTRLAADIFRPAKNGKPVTDPLPVIWTHHRYHRASVKNSKLPKPVNFFKLLIAFAKGLITHNTIQTQLDNTPWLQTLIKQGYVIGVVDVRGGGASYGLTLDLSLKKKQMMPTT